MGSDRVEFIQGNEAMAEGAFAAGARFYAGYPITPSSEIAEMAARHLPQMGGVFIQMEDEIGSIGAMLGASLAGYKSFTATSGPGFSLMQENLGVGVMAEIPCVIINVQRSGPSTGLATKPAQGDVMQARWGTHGDHPAIAISPMSVQECFDLMITAFNYSEKYRTPVIMLADEVVGHMREKVVIRDPSTMNLIDRKRPDGSPKDYLPYQADDDGVPPMGDLGSAYIQHANGSMHDETGFPNTTPENADKVIRRLHDKVFNDRENIVVTKEYFMDDAEIAIISYGSTSRTSLQVVEEGRKLGKRIGLLHLTTIWPFADQIVSKYLNQVSAIIVPEMNLGQLIGEVKQLNARNIPVVGVNKVNGEAITPNEIQKKIEEVASW